MKLKIAFVWLSSLCLSNSKQLMGSFYPRNWGMSREIEVYETSSRVFFSVFTNHAMPGQIVRQPAHR